MAYAWTVAVLLSACNGGISSGTKNTQKIGFSADYFPPTSNYDDPNILDSNFKILESEFVEPYWVGSLEMDNGALDINTILIEHDRVVNFSFPSSAPDYLTVSLRGWAPATENMILASKEIFFLLNSTLNARFIETDSASGLNNIVIAQSIQVQTSGFSYFPNNFYQLGSDVFISKDFSNPFKSDNGLTNYDYEVLIHEIGHALGLKHPFEGDRNNHLVLNSYEDQTEFTVMSYNDVPLTFDGSFRSLDWMTLTKLYGVNPEFNSGDNVYKFDKDQGTFIIDGNGLDAINMPNSLNNIYIDLRPGMHSYEGKKSSFITDPYQLTISHGSEVENVETGHGDDTVIGNHMANIIVSAAGDDKIFAGEGSDIVYPGIGKNTIDLSEDIQAKDTIIVENTNNDQNLDTVYGFVQGIFGDSIDVKDFDFLSLAMLPLVDSTQVPFGYIDNCLVRVYGQDLSDENNTESLFVIGGSLENLKLSSETSAILVFANSQDTGEMQNVYAVENRLGNFEVHHIVRLEGNYLDIDNWTLDNFMV